MDDPLIYDLSCNQSDGYRQSRGQAHRRRVHLGGVAQLRVTCAHLNLKTLQNKTNKDLDQTTMHIKFGTF